MTNITDPDYKQEIEEILYSYLKFRPQVNRNGKTYTYCYVPNTKIPRLVEALTHLIETEKKRARIEELKDMLESDNDPTQCVHCEILSRLSELQGKDK